MSFNSSRATSISAEGARAETRHKQPPLKRRKTASTPNASLVGMKDPPLPPSCSLPVVGSNFNIQQAKQFAVKQAEQEGCLGNYRCFDSAFGNFLVPAIPSRHDLFR